jgi:hypothetical protein
MELVGSKLEASLAIAGKFSEEGLPAMTQGEDTTTALAKALVEGLETEGVEQIWSELNQGNALESVEESRPDELLLYADLESLPMGRRTKQKKKRRNSDSRQLLLFGHLRGVSQRAS